MKEMIHQMLLGMGSIFFAPFGMWPQPTLCVTLPSENATWALAHDFARSARDFHRAIEQVEHAEQLELRM